MTVPLSRSGPDAVSLPLTIRYQGCKEDSLCYPPQAAMVPFAQIAYVLCGAAHQAAGPRQDPREKTMKPAVKLREKEEKHSHQIKRKR